MNEYLLFWKNLSTKKVERQKMQLSKEQFGMYVKLLLRGVTGTKYKLIDIKLVELK